MRDNRVLRRVFIALSVVVAIVIFVFSAQTAEKSSAISGGFSAVLSEFLGGFLPQPTVEFLMGWVRKAAHIFLFASLSLFVCLSAFTFNLKGWLYFAIPLAICFIYACLDEFHQLFVEGRAGLFSDVLIDGIGFLGMNLLCNLTRIIFFKPKNNANV